LFLLFFTATTCCGLYLIIFRWNIHPPDDYIVLAPTVKFSQWSISIPSGSPTTILLISLHSHACYLPCQMNSP
jgi:hypothetical protein